MKFPGERLLSRALWRGTGLCAFVGIVAACASTGNVPAPSAEVSAARANGPRADFPILIGPTYAVNGITYTPSDTLNYDEVGYITLDAGAMGITGAHHTLPVPSYVEVTSLESGRTILVRLERRGPMASNDLIALSPAALEQLGATGAEAVRVRRVNPPEEQRAALRRGDVAPQRMDTPMSLVAVLRRELAPPVAVSPAPRLTVPAPATSPAPSATSTPAPSVPSPPASVPTTAVAPSQAAPSASRPPAAIARSLFVQAATFSTEDRAKLAAAALDGSVLADGKFFRVRTGPFATREEAQASLAKVKAAGYDDARILTRS